MTEIAKHMNTHNRLTIGKDKDINIINCGLNKENRYIDVIAV